MLVMMPYTQTGIELAQQGHRHEALPYLRYAVMNENANADVWLWLAHVTPEIQEYRQCVFQALSLQPTHPTALRMQSDLNYQGQGVSPPLVASPVLQQMEQHGKREKRWRRWLIVLNILLITTVCSWATAQGLDRLDTHEILTRFSVVKEQKQLDFAIGSEAKALGFEVTIPNSWFLADEGSPSWREKRSALEDAFPESTNFWRDLETDLGDVVYNDDGTLSELVAIIETDPAQFDLPDVPRLELIEMRSLSNTTCDGLEALADQEHPQVSRRTGFVEAAVKEREDCIYFIHTKQPQTRRIEILVPVDEDRVAVWRIQIPEAIYADYEDAIETILDTLRHA